MEKPKKVDRGVWACALPNQERANKGAVENDYCLVYFYRVGDFYWLAVAPCDQLLQKKPNEYFYFNGLVLISGDQLVVGSFDMESFLKQRMKWKQGEQYEISKGFFFNQMMLLAPTTELVRLHSLLVADMSYMNVDANQSAKSQSGLILDTPVAAEGINSISYRTLSYWVFVQGQIAKVMRVRRTKYLIRASLGDLANAIESLPIKGVDPEAVEIVAGYRDQLKTLYSRINEAPKTISTSRLIIDTAAALGAEYFGGMDLRDHVSDRRLVDVKEYVDHDPNLSARRDRLRKRSNDVRKRLSKRHKIALPPPSN